MVSMNKEIVRLQTELSAAYVAFIERTNALEPDKRLQAGVSGAWSPKDVIAHLIGWDSAFQTFIANPDEFDPRPLYETHTFNAHSVAAHAQQTWQETVNELESGFANLQTAVSTVTEEMKIVDRVCSWLEGRTTDYVFHTSQLDTWLSQPAE